MTYNLIYKYLQRNHTGPKCRTLKILTLSFIFIYLNVNQTSVRKQLTIRSSQIIARSECKSSTFLQIKAPEPRQHNAVLIAFLSPEHKIGIYLSTAFFGHCQHLYGAHYFDYTIFHFVHSLTPLKEPFQNCYLMFFVLHKLVLHILLPTYHMICFYK